MATNQITVKSADFLREFLVGKDAIKCYDSLAKLARHFVGPVVVTGGIAISWHLLKNGSLREKGRLNDIDTVVASPSRLRPSLSQDFLIAHFHPSRERGKILIQLVDKERGTRIDVFTPNTESLTTRLTDFAIGETWCRVVSAEDLSAKLLSIIYPTIEGKPAEPKYVEHFRLLSAVVNSDTVREVWREYRKESQLLEFEEAAEAIRLRIQADPDLLQVGRYGQDINQACQWCHESEIFSLAPRSEIYKILGYV